VADFLMPALGADMDEGTLLEWLVKPGDQVRKGDVIAVVDTDKAAIEVESFASGIVERLIVGPGERVPVGTVLATISGREGKPGGAAVPAAEKVPPRTPRQAAAAIRAATRKASADGAAPTRPAHPEIGSPLVRHLAEELGVDLENVRGTGHGGAVTRADVSRAARPAAAGAAAGPGQNTLPEAEAASPVAAPGRRRVTPLARRLAAELGVDLSSVVGSGAAGAVREADVREAAQRAAARVAGEAEEPLPPQAAPVAAAASPAPRAAGASASSQARLQAMRQVTARLMARSKREIPHYYLSATIDLTRAMAWMHDRNRDLDVTERLVPSALLLKAAAGASRQVPAMNGFWIDDHFVSGEGVHLGVAVSLRGGGLVTPAIHDAADLPLLELMDRLRDLVTRARTGRLRGSELTDATITVTNLGDQGVESVYGVIYPPQVALIGYGKVLERPVAVGGLVGVRPVVIATLAADHRATDGYTGARFLNALDGLLQRPEEL
jgi:pyruvate dehydrogenase E2 component (dihydrolipoamide acetyltransferase)